MFGLRSATGTALTGAITENIRGAIPLLIIWIDAQVRISVAYPDPPDPHVFGPPGSGS
jgi:hypothetical protein